MRSGSVRPAVGAGVEALVGDDPAGVVVEPFDESDFGDDTSAVDVFGEEDHDVQGEGGEFENVGCLPIPPTGSGVDRESREHRHRRVGVNGAHRPTDALGHCFEHVDDLGPTNLADHDASRREPFDRFAEIGERDRTDTFAVRSPFHEHQHVVVAMGHRAEMQFGFLLQHDDPFVGGALVEQRSKQGGLADTLPTGDQQVASRAHQRGEQRGEPSVVHATAHQLALIGIDQAGAAAR